MPKIPDLAKPLIISWKKSPDDITLFAIYKLQAAPHPAARTGQYTSHTFAAATARKSNFATLPAGAYLNLPLWRESQKRWEIRMEILERLNKGHPIDDSFIGTVTIRRVVAGLGDNRFVIRTDVKSYYASVDHVLLMDRLARHIEDRTILNLLGQYMKRTSERGGWFFDHERGISLGYDWHIRS